jgi:hypothetical protein
MKEKEKGEFFEIIDLSEDVHTKHTQDLASQVNKSSPLSSIIELLSSSDIRDDTMIPTPIATEDEETIDMSDNVLVSNILSTKSTLLLSQKQDSYCTYFDEEVIPPESIERSKSQHSLQLVPKTSDTIIATSIKRGSTIATTTPSLVITTTASTTTTTTTTRHTPIKRPKKSNKPKQTVFRLNYHGNSTVRSRINIRNFISRTKICQTRMLII